MDKMCWACTELYDDSLDKCPFCGAPKERPMPVKVEPKAEVKQSHKAKVPVKKGK